METVWKVGYCRTAVAWAAVHKTARARPPPDWGKDQTADLVLEFRNRQALASSLARCSVRTAADSPASHRAMTLSHQLLAAAGRREPVGCWRGVLDRRMDCSPGLESSLPHCPFSPRWWHVLPPTGCLPRQWRAGYRWATVLPMDQPLVSKPIRPPASVWVGQATVAGCEMPCCPRRQRF